MNEHTTCRATIEINGSVYTCHQAEGHEGAHLSEPVVIDDYGDPHGFEWDIDDCGRPILKIDGLAAMQAFKIPVRGEDFIEYMDRVNDDVDGRPALFNAQLLAIARARQEADQYVADTLQRLRVELARILSQVDNGINAVSKGD